MNCIFCDGKLADATRKMDISISRNCELAYYWYEFLLCYYVCVNKRVAIVDWGWSALVRKNFFAKGTFILYRSSMHKEFEIDLRVFLKEGFVF